jgi:YVTN family beta-propeller protein
MIAIVASECRRISWKLLLFAMEISYVFAVTAHAQPSTPPPCPAAASLSNAESVSHSSNSSGGAFAAAVQPCMMMMHRRMEAALTAPQAADAAFALAMIAHHQGAIDMAVAEIRFGQNEQLRRLAQEIVVTQQQEIQVMRSTTDPLTAQASSMTSSRDDEPVSGGIGVPISHRDRVYAGEQFSNTVSVTDPADNKLLGVIRLGDPLPGSFSPLYRGQVLVHGLGFSPDGKTLVVVSIGSNSATFIETANNTVKHVTYVGRSPHEAFFTPDGKEVWVTVRGEDYVSVIDAQTYEEKTRIKVPAGPGMQIFSPDGKYGYVCSSFTPQTVVVSVAEHRVVGQMKQDSPFCPNIAVTPDGSQVWLTLKDIGETMAFDGRPPFSLLKTFDTGPITNHVNFASNANGTFAYVTVGGLNQVQVFRTSDFNKVATIHVGRLPHGVWPSGDGSRVYVGLENADALVAISTLTNQVVATIPIGQAPQAVVYVPNAVPVGDGTQGLQPLGVGGQAAHLSLVPFQNGRATGSAETAPTSVTLFDQGLLQVLQAAVTGLQPRQPYVLALSTRETADGTIEPLSAFTTNPAGSAIVNSVGPIRQTLRNEAAMQRRYLVILSGTPDKLGLPVQIQVP